jgi:hypothetical protein
MMLPSGTPPTFETMDLRGRRFGAEKLERRRLSDAICSSTLSSEDLHGCQNIVLGRRVTLRNEHQEVNIR